MNVSVTTCSHFNALWMMPLHVWVCKDCDSEIQPKDRTFCQKVDVSYAPHWDEFRKTHPLYSTSVN